MEPGLVIEKTQEYVKASLSGEGTGHDWWHIYRVLNLARTIQKEEGGNLFIIELGALLHDIADWKFHQEKEGSRKTKEWLEQLQLDRGTINAVCYIVDNISFKGAGVKCEMKSLEGKIVQDADRLDAMGAMGIARAFAYGGHKGTEFYNPNIKPVLHTSVKAYTDGKSTTINHFYEKLLLLKERMNTKAAKQIAEKRHEFMEQYLDEFFKEWEGKA